MQTLKIEPLKEKQEEISDLLISLGQSRNISHTLACMQDMTEVRERDLETKASLRQPEVSIVMSQLKERGWVQEREQKMPGKGRPHKVYSFKVTFKAIIAQLEEAQVKVDTEAQARIKRLRNDTNIRRRKDA